MCYYIYCRRLGQFYQHHRFLNTQIEPVVYAKRNTRRKPAMEKSAHGMNVDPKLTIDVRSLLTIVFLPSFGNCRKPAIVQACGGKVKFCIRSWKIKQLYELYHTSLTPYGRWPCHFLCVCIGYTEVRRRPYIYDLLWLHSAWTRTLYVKYSW
jgi:hypothetical protein